ncbi:50S ribosomal protein L6 [Zavarzinia sp. CC-PAN008]|uniref:50S ribosomal protein L6 n=1 Tax=Zavarzinia sp. CC-PAN008 TaxID=3243332 RepID=UPI003F742A63
MSRIGKKPVTVPKGVTVTVNGQEVTAKGPKGELSVSLVDEVVPTHEDGAVKVTMREDTRRSRMMWGLSRTLVSNIVKGVSDGWSVDLEITGVGYRAAVQGKVLNLQLGYSHDVQFPIPDGISIKTDRPTAITVSGIDVQQVGEVAAKIRGWRPPEPYKGKGVRYAKEQIFRKEGKKK